MTDKTEAMDLAKTLDELCKAATQTEDDIRYYSGGSKYNEPLEQLKDRLVDLYRTGKLIVVPDDAVERMAIGISDGLATRLGRVREDWLNESTRADAAAALAALKGADHAG